MNTMVLYIVTKLALRGNDFIDTWCLSTSTLSGINRSPHSRVDDFTFAKVTM